MQKIHVHIGNNPDSVPVDRNVFELLLDKRRYVQKLKVYQTTLETRKITIRNLKDLARRAHIPYPLFFAPEDKVRKQIKNTAKQKTNNTASKKEFSIISRGTLYLEDMEFIIDDLTGRQGIMNKLYPVSEVNELFCIYKNKRRSSESLEGKAKYIREYFDIDLVEYRRKSKTKALAYIVEKLEAKNFLVSFSSYNYMPQNIPREAEFSALCINDKFYPYIFINRRDEEQNPKIYESESRQILSIFFAISAFTYGDFFVNNNGKNINSSQKKYYKLAQEILLPINDLCDNLHTKNSVNTLEDIKQLGEQFNLTPKAILQRLKEEKLIKPTIASFLFEELNTEMLNRKPTKPQSTNFQNGNLKYNGRRFSKDILNAMNSGNIDQKRCEDILFYKQKPSVAQFNEYMIRILDL